MAGAKRPKALTKSTPEPAAMSRAGCARYRAAEMAENPAKKGGTASIDLALLRAGFFYSGQRSACQLTVDKLIADYSFPEKVLETEIGSIWQIEPI